MSIPKLILAAFVRCYGDESKLNFRIDGRKAAAEAWQGSEHDLQKAFFGWLSTLYTDPRFDPVDIYLVHAIPNGGGRSTRQGSMLKAEGVKGGVPDVFVPLPRAGFHGLYIEFKKAGGSPSEEQRHFIRALCARGFLCFVVNDLQGAKDCFTDYVTL